MPATERRNVLSDQLFCLLFMLVKREGAMVTREEIQKKFWPNDTTVEFDHSINVAIGKLRKALGDCADEPKYIETLARRRGYRLEHFQFKYIHNRKRRSSWRIPWARS